MEPYPYDPDRAKQLLKEAGYPKGFDVNMWIVQMAAQSTETPALSTAVAGYWEEIGINVKIETYNVMAKYGDILSRKTAGVVFAYTGQKEGPPWGRAYSLLTYSKATRFPLYESTELDALVDGYLEAFTPEERDSFAEEITRNLHGEYAFAPIAAVDMVWATSDTVANYAPQSAAIRYYEYLTHGKALGTFRLFEP
ncbi:MAG: hypothetical protein FJZ95_10045 [Chloroflexi bacterium]|nr:hypothetical protein [Chloroflexota bacterium]